MSEENNFSNQKSALEAYFESLLGDELLADETPVEQSAAVISTKTVTTKRSSVESMLAAVEEKSQADLGEDQPVVAEEAKPTIPKEKVDFAEPALDIIIPMPEVAPAVIEETIVEVEVITAEVVAEVQAPVDVPVEAAVEVAQAVEVVAEHTAVVESAVPEWAEGKFQCLLFNVGGLSLAVPLVILNGVIPWSDKVVETPNQTDWYLGVLMNHGHKVQVIDTAVMVLPEEHRTNMEKEPKDRLSHILLVDDQRWGLACDSIGDVIWLNNDEVKWRTNKSKRPWLLGTAVKHMCAMMDTKAFAEMLQGKNS